MLTRNFLLLLSLISGLLVFAHPGHDHGVHLQERNPEVDAATANIMKAQTPDLIDAAVENAARSIEAHEQRTLSKRDLAVSLYQHMTHYSD
jgi:hypothetical protein